MIEIKAFDVSHVDELVRLYQLAPTEYSQYFHPFPFDARTFERLITTAQDDRYFIALYNNQIAGFYMLRGFDEGYQTPAYGVWIAPGFSGQGVAHATLDHAVSVCTKLHCKRIMLKVHPANRRARMLYEGYGFQQQGFDQNNGNSVYILPVLSG